jgi:hypothetical protein
MKITTCTRFEKIEDLPMFTKIRLANHAEDIFAAARLGEDGESWQGLLVERYPGDAEGTGIICLRTGFDYGTEEEAKAAVEDIPELCEDWLIEMRDSQPPDDD